MCERLGTAVVAGGIGAGGRSESMLGLSFAGDAGPHT